MMGIYLTLFGGIILTIGDILAKEWVKNNQPIYFFWTLGIYLSALCLLILSYRYENIAVASILLVVFNIIILSLLSHFYFHEPLSLFQVLGIIAGLICIFLLER